MKKLMRLVGALAASLFVMAGITGCGTTGGSTGGSTVNPEQAKAIAQAAGSLSALVWISYDNPTDAQKASVVATMDAIKSKIGIVGTNTYVEVVYPLVQAYVASSDKIPAIDKPLAMAGGLAILSGIDIMFASHPTWKTDVQNVGSYVGAFITGAETALVLPCTDGSCEVAVKQFKIRSALKLK